MVWAFAALAAGAAVFLYIRLGETKRLASLERERRIRAEEALAGMETRMGALRKEVDGLWEQLDEAREWKNGRDRLLEEVEKKLALRSKRPPQPDWKKRLARARAMLPLTEALNRCLRLSGYSRLRFFSIQGREGKTLLGVDLHHLDASGLVDHVVKAEKLYLTLDPGARTLRLTSPRGKELDGGKWVSFGREGWELVLPGIDPKPWKGLGFPVVEILPEPPRKRPEAPPFPYEERRSWLDRFQALLLGEPSLQGRIFRLVSLGGLTPRGFKGVELLGYTPKGLLVERFRAKELRVERASGQGIRFVLLQGSHESSLGKQPLPPGGFLLYFPGAKASEWARSLGDRFLAAPAPHPPQGESG